MKSIKLILGLLMVLMGLSCFKSIPLSSDFYSKNKAGIYVMVDSISMTKTGSQGLLDMALTPGNKYTKPLNSIGKEVNPDSLIRRTIMKSFASKDKSYQFLALDVNNFEKFEKSNSNNKYAKLDYRKIKSEHDVDELLIVKVKYGILVSYYSFVETGKQGYTSINAEIVNLENNSLMMRELINGVAGIKGNWKEGENYSNLKNSIKEASTAAAIDLANKLR